MKEEHFRYVRERFSSDLPWDDSFNSDNITDLIIEQSATFWLWCIGTDEYNLFSGIKTKEKAEEILRFIKYTEIMFV